MANLEELPLEFPDGIRQHENGDFVTGGPPNLATGDGLDNVPLQQLAKRTRWLRNAVDTLLGYFSNGKIKASVLPFQASDFAAAGHDHDSRYSRTGHDHDAQYLGIGARAVNSERLGGSPPSAFASATHTHDGRYLRLDTGGTVNGPINATGTIRSHGDQAMVYRINGYARDMPILARSDSTEEKRKGDFIDGTRLTPVSASGGGNSGPINQGTWVCLGHAKANSGGSTAAERTTFWVLYTL